MLIGFHSVEIKKLLKLVGFLVLVGAQGQEVIQRVRLQVLSSSRLSAERVLETVDPGVGLLRSRSLG